MSKNLKKQTILLGIPKFPTKSSAIIMPFILSSLMTLIVSFISTIRVVGFQDTLVSLWMSSWAISWMIAFPILLILLPIVRRLTNTLIKSE
ncbi:DUF2798 domain-containing protein [Aliarcobacter lanthieri]|uniref:DUF2798 domain-containing protein n=1 Tax=Arcobacteraceae TaxID=2808963 RepID=UPI000DE837C3|nr:MULTISPECIES: DUF2798 domain-containing protein [Arcobacteraceae]MBL3520022.1 DUF2798 domain-containing protein [Aliarcobacter lanthieri]RBQ25898.1 hypothetical protein CRU88_10000 [Arcobacter sp. CECT 9188]